MTKDEALKMALDYIVATNQSSQFWLVPESNLNKTVTAIKEALAQPEQDWKIHPKEDAPLVKWAKEQTPPQRIWVGLTDEEIKSIWLSGKDYGDDWLDVLGIARAIEAKLKEKNT